MNIDTFGLHLNYIILISMFYVYLSISEKNDTDTYTDILILFPY